MSITCIFLFKLHIIHSIGFTSKRRDLNFTKKALSVMLSRVEVLGLARRVGLIIGIVVLRCLVECCEASYTVTYSIYLCA